MNKRHQKCKGPHITLSCDAYLFLMLTRYASRR